MDLKLSVPVIIIAILLLAITLYGFWVRDQPARFGELQGLDDFYLYRVSSYALDHGLSLPVPDYYRNYPFGTHPEFDQPLPFLMAPAFYLALGQPGHFLDFAIHWPAIGGAVSVFFLFFLVRELGKRVFRKRDSESGNGASALHLYTRWLPELAGLFAAFFAAVTPAFINRTGAGNYEKEGTAAFFLTLMLWLFARAYIKKDWRCGVAAGFALVGLVWSWGGSAYFFILFAAFTLLGLLLDLDVERFAAAYVPTILIGLLVPLLYPQHLDLLGPPALVSLLVVGLLAVRMGAQRFKLVKESQLKFIVAALFVIGMLAVTGLWYAGVEPVAGKVDGLLNILSLTPGVELSTVAESQPGGWGDVVARTAPDLANQALPWLAPVTGY
ncbi:MAG TPA: STT3 domain-containing protein, partial [archaeon]|nr:STT3 domain-containing protein [archaeon]